MNTSWKLNVLGRCTAGLIVVLGAYPGCAQPAEPDFSFGLIADCQYCDAKTGGVREYRLSPKKLEEAVERLNQEDLEFVAHLGDFIDKDWESFDVVAPIYEKLNAKHYHVLGNHDYSVADEKKASVPERLNMPARYYDFAVENYRFVVLDGNDISFHAAPSDSDAERRAAEYYDTNKIKSPKWNGAIGDEQLTWLEDKLSKADAANEKVVLFAHFPVYPENVHNLWNAKEVVDLIEQYDCVVAYMNGHNHAGNYGEKAGKHYLTLKGMVDTKKNSYAVIRVFDDRLEVEGFGRERDRSLTTGQPD